MKASPHKAAAVWPLTTHHENNSRSTNQNAWHCWVSRDELISDVLLWTPSHRQAKAGRPARTYVHQCADTGCSLEDLLEAMDDREGWRERFWEIRADGTTWWWWWTLSVLLYCCTTRTLTKRRNPRSNIPQNSICMATYLLSHKPFK